jgi:hypothetical protein
MTRSKVSLGRLRSPSGRPTKTERTIGIVPEEVRLRPVAWEAMCGRSRPETSGTHREPWTQVHRRHEGSTPASRLERSPTRSAKTHARMGCNDTIGAAVWIMFDDGDPWHPCRFDMPPVSVRDIELKCDATRACSDPFAQVTCERAGPGAVARGCGAPGRSGAQRHPSGPWRRRRVPQPAGSFRCRCAPVRTADAQWRQRRDDRRGHVDARKGTRADNATGDGVRRGAEAVRVGDDRVASGSRRLGWPGTTRSGRRGAGSDQAAVGGPPASG